MQLKQIRQLFTHYTKINTLLGKLTTTSIHLKSNHLITYGTGMTTVLNTPTMVSLVMIAHQMMDVLYLLNGPCASKPHFVSQQEL